MNRALFVIFIVLNSFTVQTFSKNCKKQKSCTACTLGNSEGFQVKCRWCEKSNNCYSARSTLNPCSKKNNVIKVGLCYQASEEKYTPNNAYTNVLLSAASYYKNAQECLDEILPGGQFIIQQKIQVRCNFGDYDYEECCAIVATSALHKVIAVSFRGSTSNSQLFDQLFSMLTDDEVPFKNVGNVQSYFKAVHDEFEPLVQESVQQLMFQNRDYRIVITGHSLGGALASLMAVALVFDNIVSSSQVTLYTFGMPRVGDGEFAYNHDRLLQFSWRVTHYRDIVPKFPLCSLSNGCQNTTGPYHSNVEVFYKKPTMTVKSKYKLCQENESLKCSNSVTGCFITETCRNYHRFYYNIDVGSHCQNTLNGRK